MNDPELPEDQALSEEDLEETAGAGDNPPPGSNQCTIVTCYDPC